MSYLIQHPKAVRFNVKNCRGFQALARPCGITCVDDPSGIFPCASLWLVSIRLGGVLGPETQTITKMTINRDC